jgi:hypothetical protein
MSQHRTGNEYEKAGMKKKGFSAEQVIGKLKEGDILRQRSTAVEVSRKLGVTEQTYCWQRRQVA